MLPPPKNIVLWSAVSTPIAHRQRIHYQSEQKRSAVEARRLDFRRFAEHSVWLMSPLNGPLCMAGHSRTQESKCGRWWRRIDWTIAMQKRDGSNDIASWCCWLLRLCSRDWCKGCIRVVALRRYCFGAILWVDQCFQLEVDSRRLAPLD